MKIKANVNFSDRLDATSSPCSRIEFHKLRRGEAVEVEDSVGEKLISQGFAEQVSGSAKPKSKEKK